MRYEVELVDRKPVHDVALRDVSRGSLVEIDVEGRCVFAIVPYAHLMHEGKPVVVCLGEELGTYIGFYSEYMCRILQPGECVRVKVKSA